ncbi:hypothetical protein, partial [Winogradskyella immobilis]|nr:hypothetical protein [Winogradskyella immobilis]MCG0017697.1 hypothetical protein [Winogradskyella immobilis]
MKIKLLLSLSVLLLLSLNLNAQTGPGGVSNNLSFWLKADAGVIESGGAVSQWNNQGGIGDIRQSNASFRPSLTSNALNFNPSLFFDGNDDVLLTGSGFDSHTQIIVFNPSANISNTSSLEIVLAHSLDVVNSNAGLGTGNLNAVGGSFPVSYFFSSTDVDTSGGGEYVAALNTPGFSTDDPFLSILRQNDFAIGNVNSLEEIRLWGELQTITTIQNQDQYGVFTNEGFSVGRRFGGSFEFRGDVLEVISFGRRITDNELSSIESYLSIKYGLTLNQSTPQDYVNSLGNTIYDSDGALSGFVSNIAGIGKDDASGLNQKQSISTTTNSVQANNIGLVTIGNGTIAATNILNGNDFSVDQSFMLWGNNGASITLNTPITISSQTLNRMSRIWAIQETGTVGTVTLSIPQSTFNNVSPTLIVSSNTTFNGSDTAVSLTDDGNGNFTTTVNFTDGDFFTFAQSDAPVPCTGPSISSYPYTETWNNGIGLWTQDTEDQGNWTLSNINVSGGGTPSGNTGPTGDFTGGEEFFYVEASLNRDPGPGSTVNLISPCIDLTGFENANFSFRYHMFGSDMGDLSVDVSTDNGATWQQLNADGNIVTDTPILSGQQQTGQAQAWSLQNIDLSNYNDQVIQLRFSGTTPPNPPGNTDPSLAPFRSDMSIDQINITADAITAFTPVASCISNLTVDLDNTGNATITASQLDDGNSVGDLSIDISSFDCSNIGTPVTVTLTATDPNDSSNTDTCTTNVIVNDTTDPAIPTLSDVTVGECSGTPATPTT